MSIQEKFCSECGTVVGNSESVDELRKPLKMFSTITFLVVIVLFFMPFVNFSCNGKNFVSLTGIQLVTGTTLESGYGQQSVPGSALAFFALLCPIIGLLGGYFKGFGEFKAKGIRKVLALVSVAGLVLIFVLKSQLEEEAIKQGKGMFTVDFPTVVWFIVFYIAAISVNAMLAAKE